MQATRPSTRPVMQAARPLDARCRRLPAVGRRALNAACCFHLPVVIDYIDCAVG